jgi:MarR family transcriptional regulator, 2-MHQ and catechol-resistance regulon repressor
VPHRDPREEYADALKLWVVLARAHAAIAAHTEADVARYGLSIAEFGVLEALYHKGPMLLGEVQRRILVSSGGITFLIDRLARKGLVERQTCETDRRARYAALTPEGDALIARIFPAHAARVAQAACGTARPDARDQAIGARRESAPGRGGGPGRRAQQEARPQGVIAAGAGSVQGVRVLEARGISRGQSP